MRAGAQRGDSTQSSQPHRALSRRHRGIERRNACVVACVFYYLSYYLLLVMCLCVMSMRVRRRDGDAKNNRVRGTYGFGSGKHLQIHTNIAKYYNIYIMYNSSILEILILLLY